MHLKRSRSCLEPKVFTRQRFTIQIDIQPLRRLELYPGQTCTDEHVVDPQPTLQQASERADHFLRRWQDADVQQAIIGQCGRTQLVATASLSAVANTQRQEIATPVEIRACKFAVGGVQLAEPCQTCKQIGRAAQYLFQVFGGVGRHLTAKATGGHIEEQLATYLPKIDGTWWYIHELQGSGYIKRHPGSTGKVIGSAQRQNSQTGLRFSQRQGFGDVAQRTVTAACHDVPVPGRKCFADQSLGIAGFPGQPHVELPALLAFVGNGITHVLIECLFTMKNEHCPALCHDTSSAEPYELKPASEALSVISARIHFARRMTVTPHTSKKPTCLRNFFLHRRVPVKPLPILGQT
ncbi:hypothetical protein ALP93_05444 [Pseudomonas syringae pv. helianthi]|nr:hypothetical protein ALP93_05444 [Pseudomonas syringae pv. helianthi]